MLLVLVPRRVALCWRLQLLLVPLRLGCLTLHCVLRNWRLVLSRLPRCAVRSWCWLRPQGGAPSRGGAEGVRRA